MPQEESELNNTSGSCEATESKFAWWLSSRFIFVFYPDKYLEIVTQLSVS